MYQYLKESSLAPLLIQAQKNVFSFFSGDNTTLFKGSGSDFMELREYVTGDDIKHIDWIISSKMDKPYVKIFHEEKEHNILFVPLLSASLNFGVKKLKFDTLKETLALLGFSCIKQQDPFESYSYTQTLQHTTKRTKDVVYLREMLEEIEKTPLLEKSVAYKNLANALFKRVQSPSIIFLIGDFLNAENLNTSLLAVKHEVIVILIRDRFEEEPSTLGEINITDPQTLENATVNLDKKAALKIKTKQLKDDTKLLAKLQKDGIRYLKIYTDDVVYEKLFTFMSHR